MYPLKYHFLLIVVTRMYMHALITFNRGYTMIFKTAMDIWMLIIKCTIVPFIGYVLICFLLKVPHVKKFFILNYVSLPIKHYVKWVYKETGDIHFFHIDWFSFKQKHYFLHSYIPSILDDSQYHTNHLQCYTCYNNSLHSQLQNTQLGKILI